MNANSIIRIALVLAALLLTACGGDDSNVKLCGGNEECVSTCDTGAPGNDCYVECAPGMPCDATCNPGQDCEFVCNGASECNFDCADGSCVVEGNMVDDDRAYGHGECVCSGHCDEFCGDPAPYDPETDGVYESDDDDDDDYDDGQDDLNLLLGLCLIFC